LQAVNRPAQADNHDRRRQDLNRNRSGNQPDESVDLGLANGAGDAVAGRGDRQYVAQPQRPRLAAAMPD
jgi:hypothetical protein